MHTFLALSHSRDCETSLAKRCLERTTKIVHVVWLHQSGHTSIFHLEEQTHKEKYSFCY